MKLEKMWLYHSYSPMGKMFHCTVTHSWQGGILLKYWNLLLNFFMYVLIRWWPFLWIFAVRMRIWMPLFETIDYSGYLFSHFSSWNFITFLFFSLNKWYRIPHCDLKVLVLYTSIVGIGVNGKFLYLVQLLLK